MKLKVPVGSIGFETSRKSIYSKLIRWFTGSKISHVFIVVGEIHGRPVALEANDSGVDLVFLSKYHTPDHYYVLYKPGSRSSKDIDFALAMLVRLYHNVPYGWGQIAGFIFDRFTSRLGYKRNFFSEGVVCSELGFQYARLLGCPLPNMDPNLVSPADLMDLMDPVHFQEVIRKDFATNNPRML